MATFLVQEKFLKIPDSTSSIQITFDSTPAAGDLILVACGWDKQSGGMAVSESGYTEIQDVSSTQASQLLAYKVAAGTESTVTVTGTNAASGGCMLWVGQFHDTDPPASPWNLVTSAQNSTTSNVTSLSSGTTGTKTAGGIGFASFSCDSLRSVASNIAYSNGYEALFTHPWEDDGAGAIWVAKKNEAAGGTTSTTFSFTGTADQLTGAIVVFEASDFGVPPETVTWEWVGATDTDSTIISAKVSGGTNANLVVDTVNTLDSGSEISTTPVAIGTNNYVRLEATGLSADTQYYYGIEIDGTLDTGAIGSFRTAPSGASSFKFAFGSCNESDTPSTSWARMLARDPDFFIHLGDFHYDDITTNSPSSFRAGYDKQFAKSDSQSDMLANVPTYYQWSDHDFGGNNSVASVASNPAANSVYRECVPHPTLEQTTTGIYYTFTYGRVRFIMTDQRSFKSANGATDDSSKTVLGTTQKAWFKDVITNATEQLIFWCCDTAWTDTSAADDEWESYDTERQELATHIVNSGKNVIILGGDQHAVAAHDGTGTTSPGNIVCMYAAPFSKSSSIKGTWTVGPYPASGSSVVNQYGFIDITDAGGDITVTFNGYDSSDTSQVFLQVVAESPGVELTLDVTDDAGTTDPVAKSETVVITNDSGTTDSVAKQDKTAITNDSGTTDSFETVRALVNSIVDEAGLSDLVALMDSSAVVNSAGTTDEFTIEVFNLFDKVEAEDNAGTTDSVIISFSGADEIEDIVGLSDTVAFSEGYGYTNPAGTTDGISFAEHNTRTDNAGTTDEVTVLIPIVVTEEQTDDAGTTDSVTFYLGLLEDIEPTMIDEKRAIVQTALSLSDEETAALSANDLAHAYWALKSGLTPEETLSIYDHFKKAEPAGEHWVRDIE